MASIETIPIPCWVCGERFNTPATITLLPPHMMPGDFTSRQYSAHVWMYVDNGSIREHTAKHWPMLVVLFLWWSGVVSVIGYDPLDWYAARQPTP